jgi:hypothetical protein
LDVAHETAELLNAERIKARQERDDQIAQLRLEMRLEQQQQRLKPTAGSVSPSNVSPAASPRQRPTKGATDLSVSRARENRSSKERERLSALAEKLNQKEAKLESYEARVELIAAEKREKYKQRSESEKLTFDRASKIRREELMKREEVQELMETRGSMNLERQRSERLEHASNYAAAREACLENAATFRAAQAKALLDRFHAKKAAEEIRAKELKDSQERKRRVEASNRAERFKYKDSALERLRKASAIRGEEALLELQTKMDNAELRRHLLQNAAYNY